VTTQRGRTRAVGPRLIWRLVRYRWQQATVLLLLGIVLGAAVVGVSMVRTAAADAIKESVWADQGHRAFAVQAGQGVGHGSIAALLAATPGMDQVSDLRGAVLHGSRRTGALIRTVANARLELGVLVAGRAPLHAGEATVSRGVARDLGTSIDDRLELDPPQQSSTAVRVVGLTQDPARAEDQSVVVLDPAADPGRATLWLTDQDPATSPALTQLLEDRKVTYLGTASAAERATQNLPVALAGLRYAPWGIGLLLLVLIGAVVKVSEPVMRRDVTALVSAGLDPADSWRLVGRAVGLCVFVGAVAGSVTGWAAVRLCREPISGLVGQHWLAVPLPVRSSLLLLGGLVLISCVSVPVLRVKVVAGRAWRRRPPADSWPLVRGASAVAAATVGLLLAGLAGRQDPPGDLTRIAPVAGLLLVAGLPVVVLSLVSRRLPPATARVVARFTRGLLATTAVVGVLATVVGIWSAQVHHDTRTFEAGTQLDQPPGSLLVSQVPDTVADGLAEEYRRLGGDDLRQFVLADEAHQLLRVTGTRLLECLARTQSKDPESLPDSCFPQSTMAPVNLVVLALDEQAGNIADRGLVVGGEVGLLQFPTGSALAERRAVAAARPDKVLGGNMPGMVVPMNGDIARRFGLTSSGNRRLAFLGFGRLRESDQAALRGTVSRVAPTADVLDATGSSTYQRQRAFSDLVTMLGAGLVAVVTFAGGWSLLAAERRTLRVLVDLGGSLRARRQIVRRVLAGSMICVLAQVPVVVGSAALASSSTDVLAGLWWLPSLAAAAAIGLLYPVYLRLPDRLGE